MRNWLGNLLTQYWNSNSERQIMLRAKPSRRVLNGLFTKYTTTGAKRIL